MVVDYLKFLGESNLDLVNRIRNAHGIPVNGNDGYLFIVAALKIIYPGITEQELIYFVTDGSYDQQIDAIVIKERQC
mgnify:CR=1 FL=1